MSKESLWDVGLEKVRYYRVRVEAVSEEAAKTLAESMPEHQLNSSYTGERLKAVRCFAVHDGKDPAVDPGREKKA